MIAIANHLSNILIFYRGYGNVIFIDKGSVYTKYYNLINHDCIFELFSCGVASKHFMCSLFHNWIS